MNAPRSSVVLRSTCISGWLLLSALSAQQEQEPSVLEHQPLFFDSNHELEYPANPLLDLRTGTLEFVIARGWRGRLDHSACIMSVGRKREDAAAGLDKASTRYSVHLDEEGRSIALWNGTHWDSVDFTFEPGKYHHVALVTRGNQTAVLIDGECQGVMSIGYGKTTRGKLFIGSTGDRQDGWIGKIMFLRIWDQALSQKQINVLREVSYVPSRLEIARNLVAYSHFGRRSNKVVFQRRPRKAVEATFSTGIEWHRDLTAAMAEAEASDRMILSYARKPAADVCEMLENGLLLSESWVDFQKSLVLYRTKPGSALETGRLTFCDAKGQELSSVVPQTVDDLLAAMNRAREHQQIAKHLEQNPEDVDGHARFVIARLQCKHDADGVAELEALLAVHGVTDETDELGRDLLERAKVRQLLHDYATPLRRGGLAPIEDPLQRESWRKRAYELYLDSVDLPEFDLDMTEFAFLAAEYAIVVNPVVAQEIVEKLAPLSEFDLMLQMRVAALRRRLAE